jgi:hypothetical protein
MTYPRVSVERTGWDSPTTNTVHAVALIRRQPERQLPVVPYASTRRGALVCYARDMPAPARPTVQAMTTSRKGQRKPFTAAERQRFNSIIDEFIAGGTICTPAARADLLDTVEAQPVDQRERALRALLGKFARDPRARAERVAWQTARGLSGDEGRAAYAKAKAQH